MVDPLSQMRWHMWRAAENANAASDLLTAYYWAGFVDALAQAADYHIYYSLTDAILDYAETTTGFAPLA